LQVIPWHLPYNWVKKQTWRKIFAGINF
jgi:hypothetical protein